MEKGVSEKIFPGGILLWGNENTILGTDMAGLTRTDIPGAQAVGQDTVFDLASLTKPLVTAGLSLLLSAEGLLDLDSPISRHLPETSGTHLGNVPFHRLLSHSAGLTPWAPLFREIPAEPARTLRTRLLEGILALEPAYQAGTGSQYSDFGYILAGWILELLGGAPLDVLFSNRIQKPLGISDSGFRPADSASPLYGRTFAATEIDPGTDTPFVGVVHDEHARLLGGVSGHAGLFATAEAVWGLSRAWMIPGMLYPPKGLERFLARQDGTPWTLGWDTPTPGSSSGDLFSPNSIGHLGYTGTSVWIDRERMNIIILLTHRVHPVRTNNRIRDFRPIVHNRVMSEGFAR